MPRLKPRKQEGIWKLPNVIVKSLKLKANFYQLQALEAYAREYRAFLNYVKEGEAQKKETKQPYEYVKKYRVKNPEVSAHWLGTCARVVTNAVVPSAIRGIYAGRMAFPVSGKKSPKTSGPDITIKYHGLRYWLLFGSEEIEIMFQNRKSGYYSKGLEKPLNKLWDEGICPGGWIVRRGKRKWYFYQGIPRPLDNSGQFVSPYVWDKASAKVFIVIQPRFNELGIVWLAKFFNAQNQLMTNASTGRQMQSITLMHSLSTVRLLSKHANYRLYHVRKAINILFKVWQRNFNTYRPVIILQEAINDGLNPEMANINPTYLLMEKLKDKLCELNGIGANIANVKPFDIATIRSRLCL